MLDAIAVRRCHFVRKGWFAFRASEGHRAALRHAVVHSQSAILVFANWTVRGTDANESEGGRSVPADTNM